MPYKVKILDSESNNRFLKNLPQSILPEIAKQLNLLGERPYLGRSVEAPIPAYIYGFKIIHSGQNHTFSVSYKIDEGDEVILITSFGRESLK